MRLLTHTLIAAALVATLPAQNLLPNGDFEQGATGWTMTQFNDPLGTTGVAAARTTGNGPSSALFADFKTLSPVMSATWRSNAFPLPAQTLPVSFNVMWEKPQTAPIPSPSVNRVELRIFDSTNTRVFLGTLQAPNQTGTFERATFTNTFAVPAVGLYTAEVFMRHSNLAGIPFINWVDDVVLGAPNSHVYGQGCQGTGGFVPVINSNNVPALNSTNYAIQVHDALAPTAALLALGASNTTWNGIPLPFALGGGCSLHTGLTALFAQPTSGSGPGMGTATQPLPIPNDPGLRGAQLFVQWLVIDAAAANPYQLAPTAGLAFFIQ